MDGRLMMNEPIPVWVVMDTKGTMHKIVWKKKIADQYEKVGYTVKRMSLVDYIGYDCDGM